MRILPVFASVLAISILSSVCALAITIPVLVRQQQEVNLTPVPALEISPSISPRSAIAPGVSVSPSPSSSAIPSPVFVSPNPGESTVEPEISPDVGLAVPTSPSPSGTSEPNSTAVCFPGSVTVDLLSGSTKRVSELVIGDVVAVGNGIYSPVLCSRIKLRLIMVNLFASCSLVAVK